MTYLAYLAELVWVVVVVVVVWNMHCDVFMLLMYDDVCRCLCTVVVFSWLLPHFFLRGSGFYWLTVIEGNVC